MITRDDVRAGIQRISDVWPQLRKNDALRGEIGEAVFRDRARLEPADLTRGFDLLIATYPTTAKDGGPAWPPGPRDAVNSVLQARTERIGRSERARLSGAPRRVAGRTCSRQGCSGPVDYHRADRFLICAECGAVQVVGRHEGYPIIQMNEADAARLAYEDQLPAEAVAPAPQPVSAGPEVGIAA